MNSTPRAQQTPLSEPLGHTELKDAIQKQEGANGSPQSFDWEFVVHVDLDHKNFSGSLPLSAPGSALASLQLNYPTYVDEFGITIGDKHAGLCVVVNQFSSTKFDRFAFQVWLNSVYYDGPKGGSYTGSVSAGVGLNSFDTDQTLINQTFNADWTQTIILDVVPQQWLALDGEGVFFTLEQGTRASLAGVRVYGIKYINQP